MRKVILETPYAGDIEINTIFAKHCMLDCIKKGEAPFASHLIYPQVLDEDTPAERGLGIGMGFAWGVHADACVVYTQTLCDPDNPFIGQNPLSDGMKRAIKFYQDFGLPVEYRMLAEWDELMEHMEKRDKHIKELQE